jgi:hypothetical protein
MAAFQESLIAKAHDSLPKTTPKGTPFAVPIAIWNEVLLIPKTSNPSNVHRLSDVPRYGGAILSQGLPK